MTRLAISATARTALTAVCPHDADALRQRAFFAAVELPEDPALRRFGWEARALDLREAVCLFRICANVIRHPKPDWKTRLGRWICPRC